MSLAFEQAVDAAVRAAERAHPGLDLAPAAFAEHLRARCGAAADPIAVLAALHVDELYLAFGCACGDAAALARVETDLVGCVRAAMARFRVAPAETDELVQTMRERLFVGSRERAPRIADYDGRGALRHYLAVIAARLALDHVRARRRSVPADDELLADLAAPDDDIELAHVKRACATEFRAALRTALATLDREARVDLKHYYLDGMTLEALGALHGVVPSTIARRLAKTRELLFARTRHALAERLALGNDDLDGVFALIASRMELARSAFESHGSPPSR